MFKINGLSFIATLLLTLVIIGIVLISDYFRRLNFDQNKNLILLIFSILLVFLLNYITLDYLFRYHSRKQIRKMADHLPKQIFVDSNKIDFEQITEKLNENASEIDMIKEMEAYRKEYIGNVSHELKTPLFSIQGYIETLRDGAIENLSIRDKYIERIGISVERLINVVKDLDMINRYESAEISLQITEFDINQLITEVFDLLDLDAQSKSARLKMQTSHYQMFVNADKQKIAQVLINLISNALNYSNRQKAQIEVVTSVVRNKVVVEVSDNGMGIKPEVLPRIFERFYRVESSRNRRDGGSGLGLTIVKHILDAHNENITVESTYLEGSKFTFSLDKSSKKCNENFSK